MDFIYDKVISICCEDLFYLRVKEGSIVFPSYKEINISLSIKINRHDNGGNTFKNCNLAMLVTHFLQRKYSDVEASGEYFYAHFGFFN